MKTHSSAYVSLPPFNFSILVLSHLLHKQTLFVSLKSESLSLSLSLNYKIEEFTAVLQKTEKEEDSVAASTIFSGTVCTGRIGLGILVHRRVLVLGKGG